MLLPTGIVRGRRACSLCFSVLLAASAGVASASAQTVIVRSAPQGSTIDLTMNGGAPTSVAADANGDATLTVPARTAAEAAVLVYVDNCGNRITVLLVEAGIQPAAADAGCNRAAIPSVFAMRP